MNSNGNGHHPRLVEIRHPAKGSLQLWVMKRHIHHYLTGAALIAFGIVLIWHDRRDVRGFPANMF